MSAPGTVVAVVPFVAISLLPLWCRRRIGERLREGMPPARIFERLVDEGAAAGDEAGRVPAALARAAARRLAMVPWADARYPPALAAIVDPPPLLWVRGQGEALDAPAVAIVGSRAGSPYALAVAERLAGDLASLGLTVVSGLARGVDSAAHRGALAAGSTVAVLGSGADVIYPPEHGRLADEIAAHGAIVSELAPGTRPRKLFFPLRNRIISGVSRAVVVVEAGEKSGSLITARCALEQGRDVLAVPGNVLSDRNRGGHALIRDGARLVESARDVLEELGLEPAAGLRPRPGARASEGGADTGTPDPILTSLGPGEAADIEALAARTGLAVTPLLTKLMELELAGLVARAGGGRFVRI